MAVDRPNGSLRKLRPCVAQYAQKAENSYAVRTEFWTAYGEVPPFNSIISRYGRGKLPR